jgi:DNA-directed RNA polymerase subunit M/transcription elongation factor TFIIS
MEVRIDVKGAEERKPNALYVVDTPEDAVRKVARTCPECGNDEAYQWFSSVSGEHAGVRRERTVEHHRCTKCAHLWSESR